MSTHPLRCRTCNRECVYDRHAPFGQGQERVFAVAWKCPEGHGEMLDVCPLGPLVPARELCLNCGTPYTSDAADPLCGACGLARSACPAALGLADGPTEPIAGARAAFAQGLFRRGLAILNQALQENAEILEAWFVKTRFLNSIGFNRTAAAMLDSVIGKFAGTTDRIWLLEEQSFLWAECKHGEEALRGADAATALGSDSVRTHYLRGRALGLIGRIAEARDEMNRVLGLDPTNADARRALSMIDDALRSRPGKRWWQFWRH